MAFLYTEFMKKLLPLVFVLLVCIVGLELFFLQSAQRKKGKELDQTTTSSEATSLEPIDRKIPSGFQITHQANADVKGRTVVFKSKEGFRAQSETGVFYLTGTKSIGFVTGAFKDWEGTPNSQDRYLLLYDPVKEGELPKFRVSFTQSPYVKGSEKVNKTTLIEIVDLKKVDASQQESTKEYKPIDQIPDDQLTEILKEGDIITIRPHFESEREIVLDPDGVPLAAAIYLRRFGGSSNL